MIIYEENKVVFVLQSRCCPFLDHCLEKSGVNAMLLLEVSKSKDVTLPFKFPMAMLSPD
jgi:hypothetical protein